MSLWKAIVVAVLLAYIPNTSQFPLHYVFEKAITGHKLNTLWLEFGVYSGVSVNYCILRALSTKVYGFDSFQGLPETWRDEYEAGSFNISGYVPAVIT